MSPRQKFMNLLWSSLKILFFRSIKEEKKEKLRSEIEEIRRKENDKEKGYLEHIKKAARY